MCGVTPLMFRGVESGGGRKESFAPRENQESIIQEGAKNGPRAVEMAKLAATLKTFCCSMNGRSHVWALKGPLAVVV